MRLVRRDYKSSLFCELFGSEERKGNALELYNALSGTAHDNPEELELYTIADTVFLGRKNDVAYLIGDELLLWEHQTTVNPNMPLRGLLYFAKLFQKLIEDRKLDVYGKRLLALPAPRYVVFYFGTAWQPERETLRLSDSYASESGDLEVTVTVLNCTEGHNAAIMDACGALKSYSHLIALERHYRNDAHMTTREAAAAAIKQCIAEGHLLDYLPAHQMEATDMLFTMEDEERAMRVHWETVEREAREKWFARGRADGFSDGRISSMIESIKAIMETTGCNAPEAMDMLKVPNAEREALAARIDTL